MRSFGLTTAGRARFSNNTVANEMLPTLPRYISKISTMRETRSSCVVMPTVSPTVPIAEKHSNSTALNLMSGLRQLIIKVPVTTSNILVKNTYTARLNAPSGIRLPNTSALCLCETPANV